MSVATNTAKAQVATLRQSGIANSIRRSLGSQEEQGESYASMAAGLATLLLGGCPPNREPTDGGISDEEAGGLEKDESATGEGDGTSGHGGDESGTDPDDDKDDNDDNDDNDDDDDDDE